MRLFKKNVYRPSLVMKVPDHVYVLNDMHSSNTFQSVSYSVCQHETVITCASTDSLCSVFPHPCRNPCPDTCAYVTSIKVNVSRCFEPRHVIHHTRISSGH